LYLKDTQVSDAGLGHLQSLSGLNEVWLGGTRVTPEGAAELQKALPNCHVAHW
jgi:hypothetical protein